MRVLASLVLAASMALFGGACSDGPSGGTDADADGDADGDAAWDFVITPPAPPEPPEEAALPVLTPCPEGWREVPPGAEDGVATCDPWPEGGPEECAEDEAHFPGEAGCTRIGTACPAGDWAEDLPTDRDIVYVRAGAPAGGDGTRDAPYGTIAEGLARSTRNAVIALGKGTYDEAVEIPDGRTLWGACVAETVVTCTAPETQPGTISAPTSGEGEVRNLQVRGGGRPGLWAVGTAEALRIQDVLVYQANAMGMIAGRGGRLTAHSVVVRDTQANEDGFFGRGLNLQEGGQAVVQRAVLSGSHDHGIAAFGAETTLELSGVAVLGTRGRESDGGGGLGMQVERGASVVAAALVIESSRSDGIVVMTPGTRVELSDVVVRDSCADRACVDGIGLASHDAEVTLSRGLLERNEGWGTYADGATASLTLEDVVVRDTRCHTTNGQEGRGLEAHTGATVALCRTLFARNTQTGVKVGGPGTELSVEDVIIVDTQPQCRAPEGDPLFGRGLDATYGVTVSGSRLVVERNHHAGIFVAGLADDGSPPRASLTDVIVRDTAPADDADPYGLGIELAEGAVVELARVVVERSHATGLSVGGAGTEVSVTDLLVADTRAPVVPRAGGQTFGAGIEVSVGALLSVDRALLARNLGIGLLAASSGTVAIFRDLELRETALDVDHYEAGIHAQEAVILELERALLDQNLGAGLRAMEPGTHVTLREVLVRDSRSLPGNGTLGRGLDVGLGSTLTGSLVILEGNREVGLFSSGEGSTVQLEQLRVVDTLPRACAETDCADSAAGVGVVSRTSATIELTDFLVSRSFFCGVQLVEGGTMDLHHGEVSDHAIGANVQTEPFDIDRLMDDVAFIDNARDLDMEHLPVPDWTAGLGDIVVGE